MPEVILTLERIAGRLCVVIESSADPRVCLVITPRDPEYPELRRRLDLRSVLNGGFAPWPA